MRRRARRETASERQSAAHGDSRVARATASRGKSVDTSADRILTPVPGRCLRGFRASSALLAALAARAGVLAQNDRAVASSPSTSTTTSTRSRRSTSRTQVDRAEDDGLRARSCSSSTRPAASDRRCATSSKRLLASTVPGRRLRRAVGLERGLRGRRDRRWPPTSLAMAPQTNIGSSTPISLERRRTSRQDLRRKIVNDAAAYVGELAREHDRNVGAARGDGRATRRTTARARRSESGVVDVIAPTLPALLERDRRHEDRAEGPRPAHRRSADRATSR